MAKETIDYKKLQAELEVIVTELQSGDLAIDEAMKRHEQAQEIIKKLEKFLDEAEQKITKRGDLRSSEGK
jgi:exodeoxyribonuclease VII small subunit